MNGEALGWCPEPSSITLPYSCIEVSISQVKPEFEDMVKSHSRNPLSVPS